MIEVNLLPSVKKDFLKAQQMKHTVIVASVLISAASLVSLVLLFSYVQIVQPQHKKNIQADIDQAISDIKAKENAVKVVTVQGALETLPSLQDKKQISSNLFSYVSNFTPRSVSYSNIKLNLDSNTVIMRGSATSFEQANVLANNLKSAKFTYRQDDQVQTIVPFSNVVFDGLSKSEQSQDGKSVSFQLTYTVDPVIFDQSVKDGAVTVNALSEQLLLQTDKPFIGGVQ